MSPSKTGGGMKKSELSHFRRHVYCFQIDSFHDFNGNSKGYNVPERIYFKMRVSNCQYGGQDYLVSTSVWSTGPILTSDNSFGSSFGEQS